MIIIIIIIIKRIIIIEKKYKYIQKEIIKNSKRIKNKIENETII